MNERYEGLNLVDLLALVHDIVQPAAPAFVPGTAGWWVLTTWLFAMAMILTISIARRRRRNRYRRAAEAELNSIALAADEDPAANAARIAVLLKRTALAAYPRRRVASLTGPDWASFLIESSGGDSLVTARAESLAHAAYRKDVDGRELIPAARRWIRRHRV